MSRKINQHRETYFRSKICNLIIFFFNWKFDFVCSGNFSLPPPPSKKKGPQKIFWKDFGTKPMFWDNYRPLPAILWLCKIQKILSFSVFLGKFGNLFFFKIRFSAILVLEPLKMFFLTLFRSRRWFISIFDPFFSCKNFEFLCIFYIEVCRFRQFWRNMWKIYCRIYLLFVAKKNVFFFVAKKWPNSIKFCSSKFL